MYRVMSVNTLRRLALRAYSKDVRFGPEVRAMMIRGVDILADAVAVTMGPKGRNVILDQGMSSPKITKDGVSVAKAITLKDKHQNLGAKLVQDVAYNTNEEAGDGTTTATVLARAIAKEGFDHIVKGANPVEIRRGVMDAVECVKAALTAMSRPVVSPEEIMQVATISANGDREIGELITNATRRVGRGGVITVKDGKTMKDEVEFVEGLQFDKGYVSPFFINTTKGAKVEFNNAFVLITLQKLNTLKKMIPALECAHRLQKPLLIIADDITGEALNALVVNKMKLGLQVCAVKAPSFGSYRKTILSDIAAATGATIFGDDTNYSKLENIKKEDFGEAGEIAITKNNTLLLRGKPNKELFDLHIRQLKDEIEDTRSDDEKKEARERLSSLTSGVAVLHIGGLSEIEVNERKERVNDALNSIRAAVAEGIVAGGGTAFLRCIPKLDDLKIDNQDYGKGIDIIRHALRMPCMTIANNAGVEASKVVADVMNHSGDYGYDAMKDEYGNLFEKGIIDPVKVLRTAITDAAGVASLLSTTEVVITSLRNESLLSKLASLGLGDMGGMGGLGGMGGMGGMGGLGGMGGMGGAGGMDAFDGMSGGTAGGDDFNMDEELEVCDL